MKRIYAYNLFFDFLEFIKLNRAKFVFLLIIFLCGIGIGIASGVNVSDATTYLFRHKSNAFILIIGSKSVISYFFIRLIALALLAAIIILLSFNFYLSLINYLILFFFTIIFSMHFTLYIIFFKVAVLPFVIFCLVPFLIFIFFVLSVLTIMSCNRGLELKNYGCYTKINFISFLKACLPAHICLGILIVLESVLAFFLTLGIAI